MAGDDAWGVAGQCHCGAVRIRLAAAPARVTRCNCSLCHATGALWCYVEASDVDLPRDAGLTETYAWNGKHVDFHRCRNCGCVTHWVPRDRSRGRRGINARLFAPAVLAAASMTYRDGAETGLFADCPPVTGTRVEQPD